MDLSKPTTESSQPESVATEKTTYPVSFTGSGSEYFKIWIVNILLTIITLYIYSAWAKVRTKRYFHGNTILDGSSFEYHAKPLQILLSRLVAAALLVAVTFGDLINPWVTMVGFGILFLVIPWAIWRSTKFNMRMTSYRNVRFGFDGSVWPVYLYQFVLPLIGYLLVGLCFYVGIKYIDSLAYAIVATVLLVLFNLWIIVFTHQRLSMYFLNHYLFGKSRFAATLSLTSFYKTYLIAALLGLVTLGMLVALLAMSFMPEGMSFGELIERLSEIEDDGEIPDEVAFSLFKLLSALYVYIFLIGYFLAALITARVRNHVFGNTVLDQRVSFESDIPVTGLWWVMFSNLLLILISFGFARPFTQVRMAKYMARHTKAVSATPLDDFVGEKRQQVSAFGDELGDAFDMDMDVGF